MTLGAYTSGIFVAGMLAGVATALLLQVTPEFARGLRPIRLFLKTRDRRRAVQLWQAEVSSRRRGA